MPPSPASPANLTHNLTVIAGLTGLEIGAKLSFDESTGRFSTQGEGVWQSVARTFSNNTVTSARYFGEPIREVFSAARAKIGGGVTQQELDGAVTGLRRLRQSYAADKLAALNLVIADAEIGVRSDVAAAIVLRQKYAAILVYGFSQRMFLPETNNGVCYSFSLDWARRILSGKPTFAHSKKAAAAAATPTLSAAQKQRIMKKVLGRVAPMQATLKDYQASSFGNVATVLFPKYANLLVVPYTNSDQAIADDATGSDILGAAMNLSFAYLHQANIFLLNLKSKVGSGGHTVSFRVQDAGFQFFDSNLGEFKCSWDETETMKSLFNDWWASFYMPGGRQYFGSWTMEGVSARH